MSQTPDPDGSPSPSPASGPRPSATSSGLLPTAPTNDEPTLGERATRLLLGGPRDLKDRKLFHALTLVSVLAWVGLGADALSSSSYGPQEGYRVVREHQIGRASCR